MPFSYAIAYQLCIESKSLVEDYVYRVDNLFANNIYMRSSYEQFPEHIASLVDQARQGHDSLGPSLDEVWQTWIQKALK